jgi:hypothetical protein
MLLFFRTYLTRNFLKHTVDIISMRSFIGRVKGDALVTASSRRKGQQKQRNKKFEKKDRKRSPAGQQYERVSFVGRNKWRCGQSDVNSKQLKLKKCKAKSFQSKRPKFLYLD